MKKNKSEFLLKVIFNYTMQFLIIMLFYFLLTRYGVTAAVVSGESMMPTLKDGDILVDDLFFYQFQGLERNDLISFQKEGTDKQLIKRIVGIPGDTIQIKEGILYVNNKKVEEHRLDKMCSSGIAYHPIKLKDGEYFVLGDNRNNSRDSRFKSIGIVKENEISGKIICRLFSNFSVYF